MTASEVPKVAQEQAISIVPLSLGDIDAVEALRAQSNDTLGFSSKGMIGDYLGQGCGIGVRTVHGLVGYALYSLHRHHIRIIHLCVSCHERKAGHARRLVDVVVERATDRRVGIVKLNCRRDYPANAAWPALGFVPLAEKPAKTPGKWLVTWYRAVPDAAQQDIFSTLAAEDKVNAVIDAQILFQLQNEDSEVAKGLQADFLADLLVLHITNETLNEINRNESHEQREQSRNHAISFPRVQHDEDQMLTVAKKLERVLPSSTKSEKSDIRQLAMTATSNVNVFLTCDGGLLNKADDIERLASVKVLHPNKLIVRLDEFTDRDSYNPSLVSGVTLAWLKIGEADVTMRLANRFLGVHEKKGNFKGRLDLVLSHPQTWRTEGLWADGEMVAIRSVRLDCQQGHLAVYICRALRRQDRSLFTEYAVASILSEAVQRSCDSVLLEHDSTTPEAKTLLSQLGFTEADEGLIRECPAYSMTYSTLRAKIYPRHRNASQAELERVCSPVALEDGNLRYLMVPIKPGYARSLFDTSLAADDLFGGERSVLLRLENVYFRKKSHHHMIKAPARILWYVSGSTGVVAISHLDEVQIGSPKEMFRAHRRLGALGWWEVQELCGGNRLQEIMVLKFSHSYLFRSKIGLHTLKGIYGAHSAKLVTQSPSRVPKDVFLDIYRSGFHAVSTP